MCLPHTAVTQFPHSHPHLTDHRHHSTRFAFFSPSSIHYGTYPENPTRLIFSRAQILQYLSFQSQPYLSTPDHKSDQRRRPSPHFLVVFHEVLLWLGPIDRVCVLFVAHLYCVTNDGSQTCTIFLVNLRLLSRYPTANTTPVETLARPPFTSYQMDDISFTLILLLPHFAIL